MADRITKLVPVARPVFMAGSVWPVWECRVSDLADLQAWLDGQWHDPLPGLADAIRDAGPGADRDRLVVRAIAECGDGPAAWGSPEGRALVSTLEGTGVLLWVGLRRSFPGVTTEDIAVLMGTATVPEFEAFKRAFWGVDSADELRSYMTPDATAGRDDAMTWGEAVDHVATEKGWTYQYIYGLTLSEFRNAQRSGREPAGEWSGTGMNAAEANRLQAEMHARMKAAKS